MTVYTKQGKAVPYSLQTTWFDETWFDVGYLDACESKPCNPPVGAGATHYLQGYQANLLDDGADDLFIC